MNLIDDAWLPVSTRSGEARRISAAELVSPALAPVDITAPRPDFRGALFQFAIGLLQTAYAPRHMGEWMARWNTPPGVEELQAAFAPLRAAFDLDTDGPAFLQDFTLGEAEPLGIGGLLVDAPGGNTVELNKDHFVHRGGIAGVCPACAAAALLTLQLNAPSGGVGYRVSLRGGGPLTTLRMPAAPEATLFQKLWANVLPKDALQYPEPISMHEVLPWMAPTRTSDSAGVGTTEPLAGVAHPLQAYWGMPRRIRLDFTGASAGQCDLCGESSTGLVHRYRTRNYGVNYGGPWVHPLTPYNYDPKQSELPISLKGQKGGIGYRHWSALTQGSGTIKAAQVVRVFSSANPPLPADAADVRLWAFGADFDNAKIRCFYDTMLPLYAVQGEALLDFRDVVQRLLSVATEAAQALNRSVKEASSNRPAERESDPAVAQSFWQASEAAFYGVLSDIAARDEELENDTVTAAFYKRWLLQVRRIALGLFDQWVVAVPIEDMKMKRVVEAKAALAKSLNKGAAQDLWKRINAEAA
jgi:CRISPR system Cascade subunit CasA